MGHFEWVHLKFEWWNCETCRLVSNELQRYIQLSFQIVVENKCPNLNVDSPYDAASIRWLLWIPWNFVDTTSNVLPIRTLTITYICSITTNNTLLCPHIRTLHQYNIPQESGIIYILHEWIAYCIINDSKLNTHKI